MEPSHDFSTWDGSSVLLRSPLGPCFRILPDGAVEDLEPDKDHPDKQALREGQVLGHSLHIRKILALHGSASLGPKGAVAVLGFSGWGKSTMAAHLRDRGYGFLTDDVLAVQDTDGIPTVTAGPEYARLWPDTLHAVGLDPSKLDIVWAGYDKRRVPLPAAASHAPLAAIYVLDRTAKSVHTRRLSPGEAMIELVRHSFAFLLLRQRSEAWHFNACSRLAATVPISVLGVPEGLQFAGPAADLVVSEQARPAS